MNRAFYCGQTGQILGIEEHRLVGGRGDGMRLLQVRNGLGLEFTVSEDRCCDISRLSFRGDNYGFFSADGYVAPQYFDNRGFGWLRSFTAGFLTTCGLTAVGDPELSDGEELPLHGYIANQPAEHVCWYEEQDTLTIRARIPHAQVLGGKLMLNRRIDVSTRENCFTVTDTVANLDARPSPLMILYHMNMGYPLLSETAELFIPSGKVEPATEFARQGLSQWDQMIPPQPGIQEQCYYHSFDRRGVAALFNPAIGKGVEITFDPKSLEFFTEWKMMGVRDYVLGLEPGNCLPEGRNAMRERGQLVYLAPEEEKTYQVSVRMVESRQQWETIKERNGNQNGEARV